jgi:hypothetical protein
MDVGVTREKDVGVAAANSDVGRREEVVGETRRR